ncbi:MAG: dephospho-CoA kinase [Bifidobacteriaceae bacterium]|jgi:dephospho-CoA kinase|nr:dephospho-CoA kinase [Bifidobacteriaceae bacterium]
MNIGLTGGIGSGKTTVSQIFRDLGAYVIDYDQLSNQVELDNPSLVRKIAEIFQSIPADRPVEELDHKLIAKIVFQNPQKLNQLEKLKHPYIIDLAKRIEEQHRNQYSVFVHEVPLLVEVNLTSCFDIVVVLVAPESVRIKRLVEQRGLALADVKARINSQLGDADRAKVADFVVNTNRPLFQVRADILNLWNSLKIKENFRAKHCH